MKFCEYIKSVYDEYVATPNNRKQFVIMLEPGTWKYFMCFCDHICDGGYEHQLAKADVSKEQLQFALNGGYICKKRSFVQKPKRYSNGNYYSLTDKGRRTLYKYYFTKV